MMTSPLIATDLVESESFELAQQMAHDIRAPLSVLKVLSKKAQGLKTNERHLLDQVVERIDQMATELLFDQALGAASEVCTMEQIQSLALEVLSEKRVASSDNIIWSVHSYIQDSSKTICISPFALKRALCALLTNSVQALSGRAGWIRVSVIVRGGRLILRVKDSGKGVASEDIEKVFRRGYTIGKKRGSGLGLAYVKALVNSLEGSCLLHSRVGFGCSVALKLPVLSLRRRGGETC